MRIDSLEKYVEQIRDMSPMIDNEFFYRGINNVAFDQNGKPMTSIYRDKYNEKCIIEDVMAHKPEYFSNCKTAIEKLEMLQHYGIPTRLLDITKNYLVALYFACCDKQFNNLNIDRKNDGMVYRYTISKDKIKYNNSDTVSVLANLAFMDEKFNIDLNNYQNPKEHNDEYRMLIHQICHEKSYFQYGIEREHLSDYVICVIPNLNNPRIIAQQGAFLLFGIQDGQKNVESSFSEKSNPHIIVKRLIIASNAKSKILRDLNNCGINLATLFPELDKYAEYVKEKYKVIGS